MACVLCLSTDDPTDEVVIPKWLLRAFNVQRGSTVITIGEEDGEKRKFRDLNHFQITLDGGLCRRCNNELLSRLENVVQPVLGPMAVQAKPTTLNLDAQRLLAVWAVKTVYLLELAGRQQYAGARQIEGYRPSIPEVGWLLAELEQRPVKLTTPPPRTMVWLACWDCMTPDAILSAQQGRLNQNPPAPSLFRQTLSSSGKERKLTSLEIAGQLTYPQVGQPLSEVRDVLRLSNVEPAPQSERPTC